MIRVDREKDIRTLEVQYISDINVCNNILWYSVKDVYNENIGVYFLRVARLHFFLRGSASKEIRGIMERTFDKNLFVECDELGDNELSHKM